MATASPVEIEPSQQDPVKSAVLSALNQQVQFSMTAKGDQIALGSADPVALGALLQGLHSKGVEVQSLNTGDYSNTLTLASSAPRDAVAAAIDNAVAALKSPREKTRSI